MPRLGVLPYKHTPKTKKPLKTPPDAPYGVSGILDTVSPRPGSARYTFYFYIYASKAVNSVNLHFFIP